MITALAGLTATEFAILIAATFLAGLVRGFAGFGTAMVYLPIAGIVLSPVALITTMVVMDGIGPLPNVPRALRDGDLKQVGWMSLGALLGLPLGLALLFWFDPTAFRWGLSLVIFLLLGALLSGWRYRGAVSTPLVFGAGGMAGITGGALGLAGPPLILLFVASTLKVSVVRANLLLFLLASDVLMLAAFWLKGSLMGDAILIGIVLVVPYTIANILGARLFDPAREAMYRKGAYGIIAGSALLGLPIWS